jgi:hypothetical protein
MTDPTSAHNLELHEKQIAALEALTEEVRRFNNHRFVKIQNSPGRLIAFQMMRGLALGLGTLMGATVLVSLLAWWASQFSFIPVIGDWMTQIVTEIERGR